MSPQGAKPNPVLGILVGAVAGWLGFVAINYASSQLTLRRLAMFQDELTRTVPWSLAIVAVGAVLAFLLSSKVIGAGALVGSGVVLAGVGLALQVLPIRIAWELAKGFQVPGERMPSYLVWDGSMLAVGIIFLVLGVRRWAADAKRPQGVQDLPPYQPGYPNPQQPGQLPGQPGQQPGMQPGYPQQPGQQPTYPPQQPGGTFPG